MIEINVKRPTSSLLFGITCVWDHLHFRKRPGKILLGKVRMIATRMKQKHDQVTVENFVKRRVA